MRSRKRNSRLSAPDRLEQIYRVAARLICKKGYDATSISDIADAVGITKGGIYHHIPAKTDLLFAIMNYGMDRLEQAVIAPARLISDSEERLRAIVTGHALLITEGSTPDGNNPVTILVDEEAGLTPKHRRDISKRKRRYLDLLRDTLKQLGDEGKLKDIDVTVAAFSVLGMILWLSRWYKPGGRLNREEVAADITRMALGAVLR